MSTERHTTTGPALNSCTPDPYTRPPFLESPLCSSREGPTSPSQVRLSEPPGRSCEGGTGRGASEGSDCSLILARALVNSSRTGSGDPFALYREGSRLLLPPRGPGGRPGVSCACSRRGGPHLPPQNASHAGHVSWAGPGSVAGENPASSPPPQGHAHKQSGHGTARTLTVRTTRPPAQDPGLSPHTTVPEPPRQPGSRQMRAGAEPRGSGEGTGAAPGPCLQHHALPKRHCYPSGCLNTNHQHNHQHSH